jgi:hypothetical protein
MPGKIITAAAVILLGSTAFASAQTLAFPRDRAYVDGYGWSYGDTGPSYDPHYRVMPAPFGGGYMAGITTTPPATVMITRQAIPAGMAETIQIGKGARTRQTPRNSVAAAERRLRFAAAPADGASPARRADCAARIFVNRRCRSGDAPASRQQFLRADNPDLNDACQR